MSHKTFQLISRRIFKTALEEILYTQVVMSRRKKMVQKGENREKREKPKIKYLFQEQSERQKHYFEIGIEWVEEISAQNNLSFTIGYLKAILKFELDKNILHFLFLLEMRKKQGKLNTILNIQCWSISKSI